VSADPKEFHDLAAEPRHQMLIAELDKRIVKEIGESPDETEQRARRELKNGYHRTDKRPAVAKLKAEA
jgi:hypothetical protein